MSRRTLLVFLLAACTDLPGDPTPPPDPPDAGHVASALLQQCAELQSTPVHSVETMVDRLNALPHPVTIACAVASLPRPLKVVATTSVMSAQPAQTFRSPRLFFMSPRLITSVVPDGIGAHLLEMGEFTANNRTIKAELELPLADQIDHGAPLRHVMQTNGFTTCSICHRGERPSEYVDGGMESVAYQPEVGTSVSLKVLRDQHDDCVDAGSTTERCDLYHALFDLGAVELSSFNKDVEFFIQ